MGLVLYTTPASVTTFGLAAFGFASFSLLKCIRFFDVFGYLGSWKAFCE